MKMEIEILFTLTRGTGITRASIRRPIFQVN